jgi:hypothetical protein
MENTKCACNEEHHDMCWDGYVTFPNENCECCKNTIEYMEQ